MTDSEPRKVDSLAMNHPVAQLIYPSPVNLHRKPYYQDCERLLLDNIDKIPGRVVDDFKDITEQDGLKFTAHDS